MVKHDIMADLEELDSTWFSVEVFPPKTSERRGQDIRDHLRSIFDTVEVLLRHDLLFVSVTYNPENKTRATSIPVAAMIQDRFDVTAVAHLTCINSTRTDMEITLSTLEYFGINCVLALRGDGACAISENDCFRYASDLVHGIKSGKPEMTVGVASYPEGHPECVDEEGNRDLNRSMRYFKEKVHMGADFSITQLFLDNRYFFEMLDASADMGIRVPIIPGIFPVTSPANIRMIRKLTGSHIPENLERGIMENKENREEAFWIGVDHAADQCRELMDKVPCIHFYTMDSWKATDEIIRRLI